MKPIEPSLVQKFADKYEIRQGSLSDEDWLNKLACAAVFNENNPVLAAAIYSGQDPDDLDSDAETLSIAIEKEYRQYMREVLEQGNDSYSGITMRKYSFILQLLGFEKVYEEKMEAPEFVRHMTDSLTVWANHQDGMLLIAEDFTESNRVIRAMLHYEIQLSQQVEDMDFIQQSLVKKLLLSRVRTYCNPDGSETWRMEVDALEDLSQGSGIVGHIKRLCTTKEAGVSTNAVWIRPAKHNLLFHTIDERGMRYSDTRGLYLKRAQAMPEETQRMIGFTNQVYLVATDEADPDLNSSAIELIHEIRDQMNKGEIIGGYEFHKDSGQIHLSDARIVYNTVHFGEHNYKTDDFLRQCQNQKLYNLRRIANKCGFELVLKRDATWETGEVVNL